MFYDMQKYNLQYFAPVVDALKVGHPVELEAALDAERVRFMRVCFLATAGKMSMTRRFPG